MPFVEDSSAAINVSTAVVNVSATNFGLNVSAVNIDQFKLLCASNDQFASPKQYVFEQKHGAGLFFVSNIKEEKFSGEIQEKSIQLLNVYGATIEKLSIHFTTRNVGQLLSAIVNNCHDKLIALKVNDFTGDGSNNGFNVIGPFMQNLGGNFPNLRYLTIEYRSDSKECPYWGKMLLQIPSLTHLELNGKFSIRTVKQFLQLNRQIESLSLSGDITRYCRCSGGSRNSSNVKLPPDLFKWLDETLPNLKHLYVNVALVKKSSTVERDSNVYLKQLQTFVCEHYGNDCWEPTMALLSGEALEILELNHSVNGELIDSVAENLEYFANLKQLTINTFSSVEKYFSIVWSANGLRNFILSKPQLSKIVIRKRTHEINGHHFVADDDGKEENDVWLKPYRDAVDIELNGFKWEVCGDIYTIEMFKRNPK